MKDIVRAQKAGLAPSETKARPSAQTKFAKSLPGARRKELVYLKELEEQIVTSRARFRERPYLQAVYELYCDWKADGRSKVASAQMAKSSGISPRRDSHPIRIIIDCSSPKTDEKMRSRWTLALQYAHAKGASPSKLIEFLNERGKGGLAGRASAFTKMKKNHRLIVNLGKALRNKRAKAPQAK